MAQSVIFPGAAGDYISSSDTNLLDADTAHLQQSEGLWTVGALSTDFPLFGDNSLKVTGGVDTAVTPATDAAMFSCWVYSVAGADFDINGSAATTVAAATWTQLSETGPDVTYTIGCSTAADYYVGQACVRAGVVATFIPSIRIVGDYQAKMKARIAAPLLTFTDIKIGGEQGFQFAASGQYNATFYTTTAFRTMVATGYTFDTDVHEWEIKRVKSSGLATSLRDSVEYASEVLDAGDALRVVAFDVELGRKTGATRPINGDVFWAELRDGISGPVVARFDADDIVL